MPPKIAFLGLGAMGFGMASNLLKKNHHVNGFDIYPPTLSRFASLGPLASTSTSPKETVKGAHYIVFMVATAAQILSCLFEGPDAAIHALEKDAVLILSSTGPPNHVPNVRRLLDQHGRGDIELVDAPVSGGTIRAAAGTLTILASGTEKSLAAAKPVLEDMAGENLYIIPVGLGAGTNVKMVHQVLAGIHIAMMGEAMGFAAAMGLNTKEAYEILKSGEAGSFMFENRVPHLLVEDETVYSALNIIVKDIGIVTASGRAANFPLFLASTTEQVLLSGVRAGLGLIDDSALVQVYLPEDPAIVLKLASTSTEPLSPDNPKLQLVKQAMMGVHLVAAAEAMCLGAKVGLDTEKLYEIISTAAGTSFMFVDRAKQMLSGNWTSKKTIKDMIVELTASLEAAQTLKYPLHLTSTALQIFELAVLRNPAQSVSSDVSIYKVWTESISHA